MLQNKGMETGQIIEKIKDKVNLSGFTDSEKDEILSSLEINILENAYVTILKNLTEKDREELSLLNDSAYHEKISSYLKLKLPNLVTILESSANEIIDEFNEMRKNN